MGNSSSRPAIILNVKTILENTVFLLPKRRITDGKYHYINFSNSLAIQHSSDEEVVCIARYNNFLDILNSCESYDKEEFKKMIQENDGDAIYFLD